MARATRAIANAPVTSASACSFTAGTVTLGENGEMHEGTHHIGEVASRTGLSLRTIRYYETVGLVAPSGRTDGGFRLYTEADVQRLLLVRSLKPADFALDELQEIVSLHDGLSSGGRAEDEVRLRALVELAAERIRGQRERLVAAELAVELLRRSLDGVAQRAVTPSVGSDAR